MMRRGTPEALPVLSRGKHRSPRKGGCFMEYASLLAGEKWSDHPKCTHPLLARVARGVNDYTSDSARSRLVGLIPRVVGLSGDDPRIDMGIAVRCAGMALPVVAESRQQALAAGLLATQRVSAELDDGRSSSIDITELFDLARDTAALVPRQTRWAEELSSGHHLTPRAFQRRSAPAIVQVSVVGIAEACIPDPDGLLYELLAAVIDDCTDWMGSETSKNLATQFELADAIR